MSEIIDLSAMLGDVPEHTYTLAGKELRYPDPTLEQSARLQRLASNLTLTNLVELTREGVRMCTGEGFDEDWFKAITLKESTHFSAIRGDRQDKPFCCSVRRQSATCSCFHTMPRAIRQRFKDSRKANYFVRGTFSQLLILWISSKPTWKTFWEGRSMSLW